MTSAENVRFPLLSRSIIAGCVGVAKLAIMDGSTLAENIVETRRKKGEVVTVKTVLETEDWFLVDKPSGWLTVPSRLGAADQRKCLGRISEETLGVRLWPTHRLDVEVSGLVLFAKNSLAHRLACGWFESHILKKTYEAWTPLIEGKAFPVAETRWEFPLKRGKRRSYECEIEKGGQESITLAKTCGPFVFDGHKVLSWRLSPLTGRSHQLRLALAKYFVPIVGDTLYGDTSSLGKEFEKRGAIALRAVSLDFSEIIESERRGLPPMISIQGLKI